MPKHWSPESLTEFLVESAKRGRTDSTPFYHLEFDHFFPDDLYEVMLEAMPAENDYRAMSGRAKKGSSRSDGKPTRTKIDLFPEYIRHMPPNKRAVWDIVGCALRSRELGQVLIEKLRPGLEHRFGARFAKVGMYPLPILTRDIPGYRVYQHTDTMWKGMTVQFYLPPDNSMTHIGTVFNERLPDGTIPEVKRMPFARNTGYAFAVADNTWHSVDPVGPEVTTRDSILLTYFVDRGPWLYIRNRGRRVANALLNDLRNFLP
jgi:hypothetical protein